MGWCIEPSRLRPRISSRRDVADGSVDWRMHRRHAERRCREVWSRGDASSRTGDAKLEEWQLGRAVMHVAGLRGRDRAAPTVVPHA